MAESSGKGAKILLIISVIILAMTVLFTAAYALVLGPDAKFGPNAQKGGSSAGTETDGEAAPFVDMSELTETPDWQKDEIDLEEAAKQIEAAKPDEPKPDDPKPDDPKPDEPKPDEPKPIENPFKDVTETDYFYEPALWGAANGILFGDMLSPADDCTRAQAMTFLWREAGSPEPLLKVSPFTDVAESDYFYKPVLWAFENGLISTPSDGRFNPANTCTRAQIMLFLYRLEGGSAAGLKNPYSDVSEGSYYYDAALWAYDRGIVADTSFNADATCTRGQFITFMYRCFAE